MTVMTIRALLAVLLLAVCGSACARNPAPHVHGVGQLNLAVDGASLTLALSSPLDNFLGFERAPRTERERAAASRLMDQLRAPHGLFQPTVEAGCTLSSATIDAPVLAGGAAAAGGGVRPSSEPAAAGKPKQAGSGAAVHADLFAEYVYRCANPERLRDVNVLLFDAFRGLTRLDVMLARSRAQSAVTLRRGNTKVSW